VYRFTRKYLVVCITGFCFAAGCVKSDVPPPSAKASGQVVFQGKPVTAGEIYFVAAEKGYSASANLDSNGQYQISSGLPSASYKVYFAGPKVVEPPRPGYPPPKMDAFPLPAKYLREATSGQSANIKAGDNKFDFKLD
jgi:hypothetical protein